MLYALFPASLYQLLLLRYLLDKNLYLIYKIKNIKTRAYM